MSFEDKQKAKVIIYKLFECDMSDVSLWEKSKYIGELALLDLNEDEYDEVQGYLNNKMNKYHMIKEQCNVNLKKSIMKD